MNEYLFTRKRKTLKDCYSKVTSKANIVEGDCGSYASPGYSYVPQGRNVNTLGPVPQGFPGQVTSKVIPVGIKMKRVRPPKGRQSSHHSKQLKRKSQGKKPSSVLHTALQSGTYKEKSFQPIP